MLYNIFRLFLVAFGIVGTLYMLINEDFIYMLFPFAILILSLCSFILEDENELTLTKRWNDYNIKWWGKRHDTTYNAYICESLKKKSKRNFKILVKK